MPAGDVTAAGVTGAASARRELAIAVGLTVGGALLLLLAGGLPWARVVIRPPPPLPATTAVVTGRDLAPLAPALGLLGLAAVAGLAATRGAGRRAVGAVLIVAGIAATISAGLAAAADDDAVLDAGDVVRTGTVALARTAWPAAAVAGGLLLAAAGSLAVARGGRWPGLDERHERVPRRPDPERELWDTLDRGEDPTA